MGEENAAQAGSGHATRDGGDPAAQAGSGHAARGGGERSGGGVYGVVMCGGSGTRLWPASRPSRPKQFLPLVEERPLFRQTLDRLAGLADLAGIVVVTGAGQREWVEAQLGPHASKATVILEPEGRDSAPAVAVAAHHVAALDPEGIAVIVASDHHVPDAAHFARDFDRAVEAARPGRIVTIGIRPAAPSSAYGYIRPGEGKGEGKEEGESDVAPVGAFVEKPDAGTAARYIAEGYLWNSGNFIAPARTFLREMERHAPDVAADTGRALAEAHRTGATLALGEAFRAVRKISVDYAVMEHTDRASVLASGLDWSDLGAWDAVHAALPKDDAGNAVTGEAVLNDAGNCLVRVEDGRTVVLSDVSDLVVVSEEDAVFVGSLARSQGVKKAVDALKARGSGVTDVARAPFSIPEAAAAMRRWMLTSALPLWFTNGRDADLGLWHEALEADGMPADQNPRARVQGRQAWVFATGGAMGWPGPWREAVCTGLDAAAIYDAGGGLMRTLVDRAGRPLSNTVFMYDQTFRILALAATGRDGAEGDALAIRDAIEDHFERAGASFREAGDDPSQSNAHMHLFEACLAWIEAGGGARWRDRATRIAELAASRFIDPEGGFLREFFDADWNPAPGEKGTVVEPGHQFEWAWLLARWARATGEDAWRERAARLFACGLRGVDPARGVAVDTMNERLEPVTERARLWPQTEWLKAALVLHDMSNDEGTRAEYAREAGRAHRALRLYLAGPAPGLWRDKMAGDGTFADEPSPASSFYHIAAAAMQLAESARRSGG